MSNTLWEPDDDSLWEPGQSKKDAVKNYWRTFSDEQKAEVMLRLFSYYHCRSEAEGDFDGDLFTFPKVIERVYKDEPEPIRTRQTT